MRNILGFFLLLLAALIQVSFLPHLTFLSVAPNLVLAILIIWSLSRPPEQSMVWALLAGIFLDLFTHSSFGIFTVLFVSIAFLVSFIQQNLIGEINFFFKIIIGGITFLSFNLFYWLISKLLYLIHLTSINFGTIDYLFKITPLEILSNLIILIILLKPIEKLSEWLTYYEHTSKIPQHLKWTRLRSKLQSIRAGSLAKLQLRCIYLPSSSKLASRIQANSNN